MGARLPETRGKCEMWQVVVDGALVRLKRGTAMRRIVGIDGGDAILRSVRSDSVVEALSFETLVDEWLLMVRVERENKAETK